MYRDGPGRRCCGSGSPRGCPMGMTIGAVCYQFCYQVLVWAECAVGTWDGTIVHNQEEGVCKDTVEGECRTWSTNGLGLVAESSECVTDRCASTLSSDFLLPFQ